MSRKTEFVPGAPQRVPNAAPRSSLKQTWWQAMSTEAFHAKVAEMSLAELDDLVAEIRGTVTVIQAQLETYGDSDVVWHRKAKHAFGAAIEKRKLALKQLKQKRRISGSLKNQIRTARLDAIRALADTDLRAAVVGLVDFLLYGRTDDEEKVNHEEI